MENNLMNYPEQQDVMNAKYGYIRHNPIQGGMWDTYLTLLVNKPSDSRKQMHKAETVFLLPDTFLTTVLPWKPAKGEI